MIGFTPLPLNPFSWITSGAAVIWNGFEENGPQESRPRVGRSLDTRMTQPRLITAFMQADCSLKYRMNLALTCYDRIVPGPKSGDNFSFSFNYLMRTNRSLSKFTRMMTMH